jgi:hypothetical protein
MRKSIILIIALGICGVLSGEGWAGKIEIGGNHSAGEIQGTCGGVGGAFYQIDSGYGCVHECGAGGAQACVVACDNDGKCTGQCPACGRRDPPTLPVLGGGDAVTHALKNSVSPAKRY